MSPSALYFGLKVKLQAHDIFLFYNLGHRQSRRHNLFALPLSRSVARAESPVYRTLRMLNALLNADPECNVFADEWKKIMRACLVFCERQYARVSTVTC